MPDKKAFAYFEIKQNRSLNTKNYNKTHIYDFDLKCIENKKFFGCEYFVTWPVKKSSFFHNNYIREKVLIISICNLPMLWLFKKR